MGQSCWLRRQVVMNSPYEWSWHLCWKKWCSRQKLEVHQAWIGSWEVWGSDWVDDRGRERPPRESKKIFRYSEWSLLDMNGMAAVVIGESGRVTWGTGWRCCWVMWRVVSRPT